MAELERATTASGRTQAGDAGYQLLFERNPLPIWVHDATTGRFLAVNDSAVRHYGYARSEFLTMTIDQLVADEPGRHRRNDGSVIDVELTSSDLPFRGRRACLVLAHDVTEANRLEAELAARTAQRLAVAELGREALEGASVSELMDAAVRIVAEQLNLDFVELLEMGEDRESLVLRAGVGWDDGLVRSARVPVGSEFLAGFTWGSRGRVIVEDFESERRFKPTPLLARHGARSGLCVLVGAMARPLAVFGAYSREPREYGDEELVLMDTIAHVLAEAVARHRADAEIRHKALHDPLTGLPNRTLLLERFERWLARAQRTQAKATVLFIDVDQFKLINDGLGHAVGDQLLLAMASRLSHAVRPSDTVARVGGDEFVVLCEDTPSEDAAMEIVDRMMRALAAPVRLAGGDHHVAASFGIAVAEAGFDAATVIQNADAAMYRAKELGGNRYELFDEAMRSRSVRRLEMEQELRIALEQRQFHNVYQPLVSADGSAIVGFEALVRWEHPERGTVPPLEFIGVAEETGLIVHIGRQVLEAACFEARSWDALTGGAPLGISVNLSARQVADPGLVETVAQVLEDTGLEPGRLSLEITESAIIADADACGVVLAQLKELGLHLVLDDFGTGYSSLSHAKRFPIDMLKIDRSFVSGLCEDGGDSAIVSAVISMGRALGLQVVAEGVETAEQAHRLRTLGCPLAQGFHFARPLAPSAIPALLSGVSAEAA